MVYLKKIIYLLLITSTISINSMDEDIRNLSNKTCLPTAIIAFTATYLIAKKGLPDKYKFFLPGTIAGISAYSASKLIPTCTEKALTKLFEPLKTILLFH